MDCFKTKQFTQFQHTKRDVISKLDKRRWNPSITLKQHNYLPVKTGKVAEQLGLYGEKLANSFTLISTSNQMGMTLQVDLW